MVYKWYDIPANWGIIFHRSHLLGEPFETTIDLIQGTIRHPAKSNKTGPGTDYMGSEPYRDYKDRHYKDPYLDVPLEVRIKGYDQWLITPIYAIYK